MYHTHATIIVQQGMPQEIHQGMTRFITGIAMQVDTILHRPQAAPEFFVGNLFTFYRYLNRSEQQTLSGFFNLYPPVLESWLHTLNFIRNACAHHSRLWNRVLPIRPQIPDIRHNPEWYSHGNIDNKYIFSVLTLLRYLLKFIDEKSNWHIRLEHLLNEYPNVPIKWMGFPENWKEAEIWK